jgi:TPR repeat protein
MKGAETQAALKEAFAKTEEPMGWYFAGRLSNGREKFDFVKKSAEGGCSWGQVRYAWFFYDGELVEEDEKVYVEWLEKAANQNDPQALYYLGDWFRDKRVDKLKAVSYYGAAVELGWKYSMEPLAEMLRNGEGCAKDLRQAVIWGAKGNDLVNVFWKLLGDAERALKRGTTKELGCDFDQLCYSLGWGLYWHKYSPELVDDYFENSCLDYYCSCVELQQTSILTFLWSWNRPTGLK